MADDQLEKTSGLLDALSVGNDPRVNAQLRQRIALQMMLQGKGKGYPKNVGEGLTAIGDSLGEIGMARRLERADIASQGIKPPPPETGTATVGAQPLVEPQGDAAQNDVVPADADPNGGVWPPLPQPQAQAAPADANMLTTVPSQPSSMLGGGLPPSPSATAPLMPTPQQSASLLDPNSTLGGTAPMLPSTGGFTPPPDGAPPPLDPQADAARTRAAQILAARGGSPQNPMLAGALPRLLAQGQDPSSSPAQPPVPGGPDQRLALNATPGDPNAPVPPVPSGLRAAPPPPPQIRVAPPVQMAQAAPQQQYPAGYVPPPPDKPAGAPIIAPSKREIQLNNWLAANQGNPYAAMKVAPELQALQLARTTRQNEANKLYEAEITRGTTQAEKRLSGQMDQQKRVTDIEHVQAQTRKEAQIEDPDNKFVIGADGVARPIKVEGVDPNAMPNVKLTEPQQKALLYYGWAQIAQGSLDGKEKLISEGLKQEALGRIPFAGNALLNAQYRQAKAASEQFVQAFLRSTSGANYGATELQQHLNTMLPRFGDDPQTLALKHTQRENFIASMYGALGPGRRVADYNTRAREASQAQADDKVNSQMEGKDKSKIYTSGKARRAWDGKRWVDL